MKNKIKIFVKSISLIDILIFMIPIIIFGIALYIYFPGIMTFDSYNQLYQIKESTFTNGHPFIHTFIELILLKVFDSPSTIAIFQIMIFSLIWTIICKYNRKKYNNNLVVFLQIIFTFLVVLNPINSIHSITLWKDILYSYCLLLFCFLVQIGIDKAFKYKFKDLTLLSFVIILTTNLRHNGLIVTVGMTFLLFFIIYIYDKFSKNHFKLLLMVMIFYFVFQIPAALYNVDKSGASADAKLLQITACFLHNGVMDNYDIEQISKFVNPEKLKQKYNPYFSDPVLYADLDKGKLAKNKGSLYRVILKNSVKQPGVLFNFIKESTSIVWRITTPDNSIGTYINTDIYAVNNEFGIYHYNEHKEIYKEANELIFYTRDNDYLRGLLYSPALYMYISIILSIILMFLIDKKYGLLILPNIFNIIGITLTTPIQDVRYLYGNFLTAYLTIIIFITAIIKYLQNKRRTNGSE